MNLTEDLLIACLKHVGFEFMDESVQIHEIFVGSINDVYRVSLGAEQFAFRVRTREERYAYERECLKDVIVANYLDCADTNDPNFNARKSLSASMANLPPLSNSNGKSLAGLVSPPICAYDLSKKTIPYFWMLQEWCASDSSFGDDPDHYTQLGKKVAKLHAAKFDQYTIKFGSPWLQPRDWAKSYLDEMANRAKRIGLNLSIAALKPKFEADQLEFTLNHNDLHPLNIIVSQGELMLIDWDNAQIAPKEFDLVKLKYWTKVQNGYFTSDNPAYRLTTRAYEASLGRKINQQVFEFCELIWLLRVAEFEKKRAMEGEIPAPFQDHKVYLDSINRLTQGIST